MFYIFIIEQIDNYKYYLSYGLLLCAYHSTAIFPESLNFYLSLDLISLNNNAQSTKKEAFKAMINWIENSLLLLLTVVANINAFLTKIPLFPLLAPSIYGYYCKMPQCDFVSRLER